RDRDTEVMENRSEALTCLLNITTAMAGIHLPVGNPLQYFKELIWDHTMAQDRFFGYAHPDLYDQVKLAAAHGEFAREPGFDLFHHGATDSYKQTQFGEANLHLTLHANATKMLDGGPCTTMMPASH